MEIGETGNDKDSCVIQDCLDSSVCGHDLSGGVFSYRVVLKVVAGFYLEGEDVVSTDGDVP